MKKLMLAIAMIFAFSGLAFGATDLNTANQKELESIKGIGPAKAKAIIDYRQTKGQFKSVDDLKNVKGFTDKSIQQLKGQVTVSKTRTGPAAASRNADETMSKDAPRPLPGKDPKPGPTEKSGETKSKKADETMSNEAPRKY